MRVRWTRDAANDLERLCDYVAESSPDSARRIAQTVVEAVALLESLPNRGRPGRVEGTRELVFVPLPFVAVYDVHDEVHVLRIRMDRSSGRQPEAKAPFDVDYLRGPLRRSREACYRDPVFGSVRTEAAMTRRPTAPCRSSSSLSWPRPPFIFPRGPARLRRRRSAQPAGTRERRAGAGRSGYLKLLRWRMVGPSRGGRVVAVAGDPVDKLTFYQGSTGGGVWKTDDGGLNWRNISDGFFNTGSVGAIAVAPSNTNIVYVGMGEACIRGNASYGDGVYKSLDGGKTWSHVGLEATRQIARVRVNPTNPDLVYVAALGDPWGPSPDRGVYRSKDGGRTWEKVLFRSNDAGAIDLVMDPTNPDVLYASTLELRRYPWGFRSAGPGTALYKTTDGGTTWTELTAKPGLPSGTKGRIGIASRRRARTACGRSSTRSSARKASIAPTTPARPGSI